MPDFDERGVNLLPGARLDTAVRETFERNQGGLDYNSQNPLIQASFLAGLELSKVQINELFNAASVDELVVAIQSPKSFVAFHAAEELGRRGEVRGVDALVARVREDPLECFILIGRFSTFGEKADGAVPLLSQLLSKGGFFKVESIEALFAIGTKAAYEALIEARANGVITHKELIIPLIKAMNTYDDSNQRQRLQDFLPRFAEVMPWNRAGILNCINLYDHMKGVLAEQPITLESRFLRRADNILNAMGESLEPGRDRYKLASHLQFKERFAISFVDEATPWIKTALLWEERNSSGFARTVEAGKKLFRKGLEGVLNFFHKPSSRDSEIDL